MSSGLTILYSGFPVVKAKLFDRLLSNSYETEFRSQTLHGLVIISQKLYVNLLYYTLAKLLVP